MEIIVALGLVLVAAGGVCGLLATLLASLGERMGGEVPLVRRRQVVHLSAAVPGPIGSPGSAAPVVATLVGVTAVSKG